MSPSPNAHPTEFSVRCACGIEYHTSDAHAGRVIPCKCGRQVTLVRPAEPKSTRSTTDESGTHRRKRKVRRNGGAAYNHSYSATTGERARAARLNWRGRRWNPRATVDAMIYPIMRGNWVVQLTALAAWGYFAAMVFAWLLLIYTSEQRITGTVIAYGPRWLSLLPLLPLIPITYFVVRIAMVPLLLAAWVGVFPIMGARMSLPTIATRTLPAVPAPGTFRVVTFNTAGGRPLASDLPEFLIQYKPDVVMLQECGDKLWDALQLQTGWQSARHGTLCTASHWSMGEVETMPRDELASIATRGYGGTGLVMRVQFTSPDGPLAVVNLHLETARRGLEGMLGKQGFIADDPFGTAGDGKNETILDEDENDERFFINAAIRDKESLMASRWALAYSSGAPLVIGGDFNMPVESTIFRNYWADFTDAFEKRGNGIGWTKVEGRWLRIRIDHLLTDRSGPKPLRIIVGEASGLSDHRPVVADYAWPRTRNQ